MPTITNNQPRDIIDGYQLTPDERKEFDYIDWPAIATGSDSASFVRYKGELLDLGEFEASGLYSDDVRTKWDGVMTTSAFSAYVIRFERPGYERVIVGYMHW